MSINRWVNKHHIIYLYNEILFSHVKECRKITCCNTEINFENVIPSWTKWVTKTSDNIIHFYELSITENSERQKNRLIDVEGVWGNWPWVASIVYESIMNLDNQYTKPHLIVHHKLNFMACEICINKHTWKLKHLGLKEKKGQTGWPQGVSPPDWGSLVTLRRKMVVASSPDSWTRTWKWEMDSWTCVSLASETTFCGVASSAS